MEVLVDTIQEGFRKVIGKQQSSKQVNNIHEKIKEAILQIYQIMDSKGIAHEQQPEYKYGIYMYLRSIINN